MDLTLKFKNVNIHQIKHLVDALDELKLDYEEVDEKPVIADPWVVDKHPWNTSIIGHPHTHMGCLFEGLDDKAKVTGISCPCPKCSPYSATGEPL